MLLTWIHLKKKHPGIKAAGFLKYIGPGLLVTVGFIDPGNWASNVPLVLNTVISCCGWSRYLLWC